MITASETTKKIKALKGTAKRLFKKKLVARHNETNTPYSLDPDKYTWNKKHKRCLGRGFLGMIIPVRYSDGSETKQEPVLCSCVKVKKKENKT